MTRLTTLSPASPMMLYAGLALLGGLLGLAAMAYPAVLLLPILLAAAGGLAWAIVSRPVLGITLYLALIPFHTAAQAFLEHGLNAPGPVNALFAVWKEGVIALVFVAMAREAWRGRSEETRFRWCWLDGLVLGSLAIATLMALEAPGLSVGLYGVRNNFFGYAVYFVARWYAADRRLDLPRLGKSLALVGIGVAGFALFAYFAWGIDYFRILGFVQDNGRPYDSNMIAIVNIPRAIGTFSSANELGMYLAMVLVLCATYLTSRLPRGLLLSGYALVFLGLLMTVSRSAFLGLAAAAMVGFGRGRMAQKLVIVGLAVGLAYLVVQSLGLSDYLSLSLSLADPSSVGHVDTVRDSFAYLLDHPFGIGSGMSGPRALKFDSYDPSIPIPESFILLVLLENGFLGGGVYLAALALGAWYARCLIQRDGETQKLGSATLLIIVITTVISCVLPLMQNIVATSYLWFFIGATATRNLRVMEVPAR